MQNVKTEWFGVVIRVTLGHWQCDLIEYTFAFDRNYEYLTPFSRYCELTVESRRF